MHLPHITTTESMTNGLPLNCAPLKRHASRQGTISIAHERKSRRTARGRPAPIALREPCHCDWWRSARDNHHAPRIVILRKGINVLWTWRWSNHTVLPSPAFDCICKLFPCSVPSARIFEALCHGHGCISPIIRSRSTAVCTGQKFVAKKLRVIQYEAGAVTAALRLGWQRVSVII